VEWESEDLGGDVGGCEGALELDEEIVSEIGAWKMRLYVGFGLYLLVWNFSCAARLAMTYAIEWAEHKRT
jgi:hypothetical protein